MLPVAAVAEGINTAAADIILAAAGGGTDATVAGIVRCGCRSSRSSRHH